MRTSYAIALGSNMRHRRYGAPERVIAAAIEALDLQIVALSRTIESRPLGASLRTYANAAVLAETGMGPPEMLDHLKALEASFGRKDGGQRWGARVLDLDIVLWSGGIWADGSLSIPHRAFRDRPFVLRPLAEIVPDWRDPLTGYTVRQLKARLDRRRPSP